MIQISVNYRTDDKIFFSAGRFHGLGHINTSDISASLNAPVAVLMCGGAETPVG